MTKTNGAANIISGLIGIFGAVAGSVVTAYVTMKVANEQLATQKMQFQSQAALSVLQYWSVPLENIYSAESAFEAAKFSGGEIQEAAKALAKAAAAGRARLGGDGAMFCKQIQDAANQIAVYGVVSDFGKQYVDITDAFSSLNQTYGELRAQSLQSVLNDPKFAEQCGVCRRLLGLPEN